MEERKKFEALSYCVERNDFKNTIRLLEGYGYVDILAQTSSTGSTLLHIATKIGNAKIIKLLLSYLIIDINKVESKIYGGYAAIHYACSMGYADCLLALIDGGADLNLCTANECHETPLHICCKRGNSECAALLISNGANPDSSDGFGHNPSFWAFSLRHFDMITKLELPQPRTATPLEHLRVIGGDMKSFNNNKKKKSKGKGGKKKKK